MRRARRATDTALQGNGMRGPLSLAGLFCAVWALVLQVSLPLATQLAPSSGPGTYDLIAAVTGRIHSGHGAPGSDHSLPVRPDVKAVLIEIDPPAHHAAETATAALYRAATASGWTGREDATPTAVRIDHAHLSRAPPSFRHPPVNA